MTKKEAIAKFRLMWTRMGVEQIDKFEYMEKYPEDNLHTLIGFCHLCEYINGKHTDCCLVDWVYTETCTKSTSLYRHWQAAVRDQDRAEMSRLALLISKLHESGHRS